MPVKNIRLAIIAIGTLIIVVGGIMYALSNQTTTNVSEPIVITADETSDVVIEAVPQVPVEENLDFLNENPGSDVEAIEETLNAQNIQLDLDI